MQKYIGILLIFSLIGSYSGSYLWLRFQKRQVRREIKNALAQINKEELIHLSFSQADHSRLDWKNPHEFEYKGYMYDVVEKSEANGIITYLCWLDKEETHLNHQLNQLIDHFFAQNKPIGESMKQINIFYKTLFCCSDLPVEPKADWFLKKELYAELKLSIPQLFYTPSNPPPEYFLFS